LVRAGSVAPSRRAGPTGPTLVDKLEAKRKEQGRSPLAKRILAEMKLCPGGISRIVTDLRAGHPQALVASRARDRRRSVHRRAQGFDARSKAQGVMMSVDARPGALEARCKAKDQAKVVKISGRQMKTRIQLEEEGTEDVGRGTRAQMLPSVEVLTTGTNRDPARVVAHSLSGRSQSAKAQRRKNHKRNQKKNKKEAAKAAAAQESADKSAADEKAPGLVVPEHESETEDPLGPPRPRSYSESESESDDEKDRNPTVGELAAAGRGGASKASNDKDGPPGVFLAAVGVLTAPTAYWTYTATLQVASNVEEVIDSAGFEMTKNIQHMGALWREALSILFTVFVLWATYRLMPREFFRLCGFEREGNLSAPLNDTTTGGRARAARGEARRAQVDQLRTELSRLATSVGRPSSADSADLLTAGDEESENPPGPGGSWGFPSELLTGCLSGLALARVRKKEAKARDALKIMTEKCESLTREVVTTREALQAVSASLGEEIEGLKVELAKAHSGGQPSFAVTKIYATPECADGLVRVADEASHSLHVLVFSLDLKKVVEAICRARTRNVAVWLVGSSDMLRQTGGMKEALALLYSRGVFIKISSKRQHIKAMASDICWQSKAGVDGKEVILLGSFNFTDSSKRNFEILARIECVPPPDGDAWTSLSLRSLTGASQGSTGEDCIATKFYTVFQAIWKAETSAEWSPENDEPTENPTERPRSPSRGRSYPRRRSASPTN
jgi:hypothetical protein